jgi:hypothetical protein
VLFARSVCRLQRQQRTGLWQFLRQAPLAYMLSAPVIYGMVIPLVILDLSITLFQYLCFRVYGIPRVCRGDYLVIDRHHLTYLNAIEKFKALDGFQVGWTKSPANLYTIQVVTRPPSATNLKHIKSQIQLRLLRLCQRPHCLCLGDHRAYGTVLVSDQTCATHAGHPSSRRKILRLWRRRRLAQWIAAIASGLRR